MTLIPILTWIMPYRSMEDALVLKVGFFISRSEKFQNIPRRDQSISITKKKSKQMSVDLELNDFDVSFI